jgi:hypothetical protein
MVVSAMEDRQLSYSQRTCGAHKQSDSTADMRRTWANSRANSAAKKAAATTRVSAIAGFAAARTLPRRDHEAHHCPKTSRMAGNGATDDMCDSTQKSLTI